VGRKCTFLILMVVAWLVISTLPVSSSWLSELLFGGSRVYTTAGITVVIEGWLRPELMDDPAAYLAFWASRSDRPDVQTSAQHLQGGAVIPRRNGVKIKVFIEPGNDDFDREVLIHLYDSSSSAKFGMKELAKFKGMYQEIVLDTSKDLEIGCNAIRVFLRGKGRNQPAYLGVGIVVAPNPQDVQRQTQLLVEEGVSSHLFPQQPVEKKVIGQKPSSSPPSAPGGSKPDVQKKIDSSPVSTKSKPAELTPVITGTVVVTTNHPTIIKILVDGKEMAIQEIRDRRVFENVPAGQVTIKVKLDGGEWLIKQAVPLTLQAGETIQLDLERRSAE